MRMLLSANSMRLCMVIRYATLLYLLLAPRMYIQVCRYFSHCNGFYLVGIPFELLYWMHAGGPEGIP